MRMHLTIKRSLGTILKMSKGTTKIELTKKEKQKVLIEESTGWIVNWWID